jgi:hypothetical protein
MSDTSQCVSVNANYKPPPSHPKHFINVSELYFTDIQGTDCGHGPQFVCPEQQPCTEIYLDNVQLGPKGLEMTCENAKGETKGTITPSSCLEK